MLNDVSKIAPGEGTIEPTTFYVIVLIFDFLTNSSSQVDGQEYFNKLAASPESQPDFLFLKKQYFFV
jgi:hypothetical protein